MAVSLLPGSAAEAPVCVLCRTSPLPEGGDLSHLLLGTLYLRNDSGEDAHCPLPPTGGLTLLFPVSGEAVLCGPLSCAHLLRLTPDEAVCGVRLRWDCGEWLWSEGLSRLTDRAVPLEPLLPGSNRMGGALERCTSPQEQNSLIARLLTLRGARQYRSTPLLRRCLSLIAERSGLVRVADLATELGCSERYLNRLLRQKVGLSTKTVCETVQLHHAAQVLLREQPRSLLHAAVACGYFDQAHMNRRCRQLLHQSASHIRDLAPTSAGEALAAILELK